MPKLSQVLKRPTVYLEITEVPENLTWNKTDWELELEKQHRDGTKCLEPVPPKVRKIY